MQKTSDFKIKLCKNCFNCKTSKKKIYCKLGYFNVSDDTTNEFGCNIIYTPYDFDCYEYDEM